MDETLAIVMAVTLLVGPVLFANGAAAESIAEAALPEDADAVVRWYAEQDPLASWTGPSPDKAYMRDADDRTWLAHLRALQRLVQIGEPAVQPLLDTLASDDEAKRILAAHALGYLGPHVPVETLVDAFENEQSDVVRLYLADAIGMQGPQNVEQILAPLHEREANGDVKKHLAYAMQRAGEPVDPAVVRKLAEWDASHADAADLGKPAPDFELRSVAGQTVRLSDHRGKEFVVLVFLYGDT